MLNGFHFFRLIPSSSHGAIDQTSMVFVAVVSIFIEVGLIYSIIVENFKLTVLYNVIMIAGLVFHLAGTEREIQNDAELNRSYRSFSFIYQTLFLCTFLVYTVGLKIRNYKADRLLRKNQIELIAKHKYSPWDVERVFIEKKSYHSLNFSLTTVLMTNKRSRHRNTIRCKEAILLTRKGFHIISSLIFDLDDFDFLFNSLRNFVSSLLKI